MASIRMLFTNFREHSSLHLVPFWPAVVTSRWGEGGGTTLKFVFKKKGEHRERERERESEERGWGEPGRDQGKWGGTARGREGQKERRGRKGSKRKKSGRDEGSKIDERRKSERQAERQSKTDGVHWLVL